MCKKALRGKKRVNLFIFNHLNDFYAILTEKPSETFTLLIENTTRFPTD